MPPRTGDEGFVEDAWAGESLAIEDEVRIRVTGPWPRCVRTTLSQGDLPSYPATLGTAAKHHEVNVGAYASLIRSGTIRRGDPVQIM